MIPKKSECSGSDPTFGFPLVSSTCICGCMLGKTQNHITPLGVKVDLRNFSEYLRVERYLAYNSKRKWCRNTGIQGLARWVPKYRCASTAHAKRLRSSAESSFG